MDHNDFEGTLGDGGVSCGTAARYEQGGRVAWPEASTAATPSSSARREAARRVCASTHAPGASRNGC